MVSFGVQRITPCEPLAQRRLSTLQVVFNMHQLFALSSVLPILASALQCAALEGHPKLPNYSARGVPIRGRVRVDDNLPIWPQHAAHRLSHFRPTVNHLQRLDALRSSLFHGRKS